MGTSKELGDSPTIPFRMADVTKHVDDSRNYAVRYLCSLIIQCKGSSLPELQIPLQYQLITPLRTQQEPVPRHLLLVPLTFDAELLFYLHGNMLTPQHQQQVFLTGNTPVCADPLCFHLCHCKSRRRRLRFCNIFFICPVDSLHKYVLCRWQQTHLTI